MKEEKENYFTKLLLSGAGLASVTKEKIEEMVDKFVTDKDLTEEGKKFLSDMLSKAGNVKDELGDKLKDISDMALDKMNIAQEDDVEKIKAQIAELQEKLKNLTKNDDNNDTQDKSGV